MNSDRFEGGVRELWQSQATEGVRMSVEQIRSEAGSFQRKINRRNLQEYVAAIAVVLFFGYEFSRTSLLLLRVGFGLLIAGASYLAWHLLSKGSPGASPGAIGEDAGRSSWLEFQRRELVRQRDLLRSIWRWYLGPVIPGLVVLVVAFARTSYVHAHPSILLIDVSLMAAVFLAIDRVNARGARRLQQQIDELEEQGRD
jgi:hypothetical protein